MEITRLPAVTPTPADPAAEVAAFLHAVRDEHMRFLQALTEVGAGLAGGHGPLANAVATHTRLTRQFLDAQRSILQRRADVDTEVALITEAAAAHAASLVATARLAATGDFGSVVGASYDVQSAAATIDVAGATAESSGTASQQQLARLLDKWWQDENLECAALIDDAHARAQVRHRLAMIEAGEIATTTEPLHFSDLLDAPAQPAQPAQPAPLLPRSLTSALDSGHSDDLELLFASLAKSLEPQPVQAAAASSSHAGELIACVDSEPIIDLQNPAADDAFRRFWAKELSVETATPRRPRRRGAARFVVPASVAAASLAAVLAWAG